MRAIVAESADKLSAALIIHQTIVAAYLHHASDRLSLFDLAGVPAGEIALPGIGSIGGITGRVDDDEMFLGFSSFTSPPERSTSSAWCSSPKRII